MLTNRELASLLWLGILLVAVAYRPSGRTALWRIVPAFLHPKVAGPMLLYAAWTAGAVAIGTVAGAWNEGLVKDTVVWFIAVGIPLMFGLGARSRDEHYFLHAVRRTIRVTVVVEFYVNLVAFPLPVEFLLLQPIVALLTFASLSPAGDPKRESAKRVADRILALGGLALILATTAQLIGDLGTLDKLETLRSLALPVWLTVAALPFLFVLGIGFDYEWASAQVGLANDGKPTPRRAKAAMLLGLRLRGRPYRDLASSPFPRRLAEAKSLSEARRVVREYRTWGRDKEAEEARAAKRLRDFAGVKGTDADGRQLDQREFAETKDALELLAACQMGWYRNPGRRYQSDLVGMLGNSLARGLPPNQGLTMSLSKRGRVWYAWRRTITGWCLGIGASGPPPDQWLFEGPEPPRGPPGTDPGWRQSSSVEGPDW